MGDSSVELRKKIKPPFVVPGVKVPGCKFNKEEANER